MPADIPPPPAKAPRKLPDLDRGYVDPLWRVHAERNSLQPKTYPYGRWRFDAPANEYQVTYGNESLNAAFAEIYRDRGFIPREDGHRFISVLMATEPVRLIPFDRADFLAQIGLDNLVSTTSNYAMTMKWSLAVRTWYPQADGIRYLGRKATEHRNFCLFLDSCSRKFNQHRLGPLIDLEAHVASAAGQYALGFSGFSPATGWP